MKLYDYRKREGLTLLQIADRLGVTEATVSRYESGDRRPGWNTLPKIVEATKGEVMPSDFFESVT